MGPRHTISSAMAITSENIRSIIVKIAVGDDVKVSRGVLWARNNATKIHRCLMEERAEIMKALKETKDESEKTELRAERSILQAIISILRKVDANYDSKTISMWPIVSGELFKFRIINSDFFDGMFGDYEDLDTTRRATYFHIIIHSLGLAHPCIAFSMTSRDFITTLGWLGDRADEVIELFDICKDDYDKLDMLGKLVMLANVVLQTCSGCDVIFDATEGTVASEGCDLWEELRGAE
jgi:hypothetical protein